MDVHSAIAISLHVWTVHDSFRAGLSAITVPPFDFVPRPHTVQAIKNPGDVVLVDGKAAPCSQGHARPIWNRRQNG